MVRTIAVLGAGTMGGGIAQVAALAGYEVQMRDVAAEVLDRGLDRIEKSLAKGVAKGKVHAKDAEAAKLRLHPTTDLATAVRDADVVIEAVPERLDLKRDTFREVAAHAPPEALLATNTSSLSITAIAEAVPETRRARFLGMHFFNPVPIMQLLEIVRGNATSDGSVQLAREVGLAMSKEPIVVKDKPGFASSRLGVAIGLEAIRMLEEDVATAEDIDKAMTLGYRHPMGPLKLTDLIGLDVRLHISEYLAKELGPRFEPPQLLREKVKAGKLGQKSGEGFYTWD